GIWRSTDHSGIYSRISTDLLKVRFLPFRRKGKVMRSQQSTPTSALTTICEPRGSAIECSVRQRVARLAELIRKDGAPYPLTPTLVNLWVDVFVRAQIPAEWIEAAFDKAERRFRFWPAPSEVLGLISAVRANNAEQQAAQKWDEVLQYIREEYHPDLKDRVR